MTQQPNKKTLMDHRWVTVVPSNALGCTCCRIGYSNEYMAQVNITLLIALSHGTYNPRAYA